jgi:hypothetical protein
MPVQPTVQETPALTAAVASAPALASSVESKHEILQLHARIQEQEVSLFSFLLVAVSIAHVRMSSRH